VAYCGGDHGLGRPESQSQNVAPPVGPIGAWTGGGGVVIPWGSIGAAAWYLFWAMCCGIG
jgi:hypothetical protein